jgi:excinuclease UvrABC nuclease subunit
VPHPDFSPCLYGQMGHCCAPCNASISADTYGARVHRAMAFLHGRAGQLLGDLARARDQAASALRYEEAARLRRDLESLATLSQRVSRLSQVVTENNLVIVTGSGDDRAAHVVLSGRLALTRKLDSPAATEEVRAFVIEHFERYKAKPVARDELEPMQIVARWLRERTPDEGRLIHLSGPGIEPCAIERAAVVGAVPSASSAESDQTWNRRRS